MLVTAIGTVSGVASFEKTQSEDSVLLKPFDLKSLETKFREVLKDRRLKRHNGIVVEQPIIVSPDAYI